MPSSRKVPPGPPDPEPEQSEPPYYEATEDLYVHHPEAGVMPALAYRAGDPVVPDVVEPNRWGGKVRIPDRFAGQLDEPPAPEPLPPPPPFDPAAAAQATPDHAGEPGTKE